MDEIERKAIEEILNESKRASERAETMGVSGWLKPKVASTNKRFLRQTLLNSKSHNRYKDKQSSQRRSCESTSEQGVFGKHSRPRNELDSKQNIEYRLSSESNCSEKRDVNTKKRDGSHCDSDDKLKSKIAKRTSESSKIVVERSVKLPNSGTSRTETKVRKKSR